QRDYGSNQLEQYVGESRSRIARSHRRLVREIPQAQTVPRGVCQEAAGRWAGSLRNSAQILRGIGQSGWAQTETAAVMRRSCCAIPPSKRNFGACAGMDCPRQQSSPHEKLGSYLREFKLLLHAHGYESSVYGHFDDGLVHCRIDFDLRTEEGIQN